MPLTKRTFALLLSAFLAVSALGGCTDEPKAKNPTAAELVEVGLTAVKDGNDGEALGAFREAAKKDPKNFYAPYNIGAILQKQGKKPEALAQYAVALEINPNYVPALYNQATIISESNPQLAITTYRRVVTLQKVAPTAYLNMGLLEAKLGLFDQAEKDLQIAIKQDGSLVKAIPKDVFAKRTPSPQPSR